MRTKAATLAGLVLTAATLYAQLREFDAVSIKRNQTANTASDTNTTPGRLSLINITPLSLIRRAFGVDDAQIVGAPGWASSERYDIVAVTGGGDALSDQSRQPLLQALLTERWHFRFHRELRELFCYSLSQAGNNVRLAAYAGPGEYAMRVEPATDGRMTLRSTHGNMTRLAEILSRQTGSIVTDDTGLRGEYDFVMTWAPDQIVQSGLAPGPSLFTALQEQLGLKLASAKRTVSVVVVDALERPTDN